MAFSAKCVAVRALVSLLLIGSLMAHAAPTEGRLRDDSKQDIYLDWLDWPQFSQLKPLLEPFTAQISKVTGPLSGIILKLPAAQQLYSEVDKTGKEIGGLLSIVNTISSLTGGLTGGKVSGAGDDSGLSVSASGGGSKVLTNVADSDPSVKASSTNGGSSLSAKASGSGCDGENSLSLSYELADLKRSL